LRSVPEGTGVGVGGGFTVTDPQAGITRHFAVLTGLPGVTALPMVAVTDRAGHRIDYRYDADGHLVEIVHHGGYRVTVDHGTHGLVTALRLAGHDQNDPDTGPGNPGTTLVEYGYDSAGRLTRVVNSSGRAMRYTYDATGHLIRWQDLPVRVRRGGSGGTR
jgi:YD repeat-containing protein